MLHEIDLSRVDLNLLVLFETVMREQHVGRAAQKLSLSPSAVSHGIARLRSQLNDPLFLRTPRGMTPTERALAIAAPIAEVLEQVRALMIAAKPFDPLTSRRRFIIASPDGSAMIPLHLLMVELGKSAPGVDIGLKQVMPDISLARPWDPAFRALDKREADIAAVTFGEVPQRFWSEVIYEEEFVVASRRGHPFASEPTLDRYCDASHVLLSASGDVGSFTGDALARLGRTRRVTLTVPHFIIALSVVAETDLLVLVPKRTLAAHSDRFGLVATKPPFDQGSRSSIRLVVPHAALDDAGVKWLVDCLRLIANTISLPT
ncbi:MAG: LysR family transcriptional regulator [Hyphomicrobiales bacterium]|nr:MAG: LysR family transcriptional regulator [Hyphomicrobiales bacterium]